jgi:hypothetical protein
MSLGKCCEGVTYKGMVNCTDAIELMNLGKY